MSNDPYIVGARILAQGVRDALLLFWKLITKPWRVFQSTRDFVMRKGDFADKSE